MGAPSHRYPTSSVTLQGNQVLLEKRAISEKTENLLSYNLPRIVNSIPEVILDKVNTHSLDSFKKYIKTFFINGYSGEECNIPNCYSCNLRTNNT